MIDLVKEYIVIPSDEDEAADYLARLLANRRDIAVRIAELRVRKASSRAALQALVEDGTFGHIDDAEARSMEAEAMRADAYERRASGSRFKRHS